MTIKFELNAAPKPQHKRAKPKRGDSTKITNAVREEVNRRSMERMGTDVPVCERCGYFKDLTKAHLSNASQGGSGGVPWNIIQLCGSHGIGGHNGKGGCHDWADNTLEGREWKEQQLTRLTIYYTGEGAKHWKHSE
jgi:hypothetical protein